jgi:hypothetical protein
MCIVLHNIDCPQGRHRSFHTEDRFKHNRCKVAFHTAKKVIPGVNMLCNDDQ